MIRQQLFRNRNSRMKELFALGLLALVLLAAKPLQQPMQNAVSETLRPIMSALTYTSSQISDFGVNFFTMKELANQAESLQNENTRLKEQLILLESLQRENLRLKQLLDLTSNLSYEYVSAKTIARSPDRWFDHIRLNVGTEQGTDVNHIVINQYGLVGKVIEVSANSSLVQLISDPQSAVACVTEHGQFPGVLAGLTSERGQLSYLQNHARVKMDEKVFTSGIGGVYPKGLLVGKVDQVDKVENKPVPDVYIKLTAIEQSLDEVLVLKVKP